jgi:NADPH2:quinone reductase
MHTIPKIMKAAAIDRFGGPDVLSIHSLPVPVPDAREVLIAVDTAGVGGWDADMREGWSPSGRTRFPLVLGTDGSGTVAAVGSRIRRLKVGDLVYAYSFDNPRGGFYAEYVAVPAEKAALIPGSLDLEHAGAIPTTGSLRFRASTTCCTLRGANP